MLENPPKKILVISTYLFPEDFLLNDVISYFSLKHNLTVIVPEFSYHNTIVTTETRDDFCKRHGVRLEQFPCGPRGHGVGFRLIKHCFLFLVFGLMFCFKNRNKFDECFVFAPSPPHVLVLGALMKGINSSIKIHAWILDSWPYAINLRGPKKLKFFETIFQFLYNRYNTLFLQSEAYFNHKVFDHIDRSKMEYLPSWSSSPEAPVTEVSSNLNICLMRRVELRLLVMGNLGVSQNLEWFLTEIAKILACNSVLLDVVICGNGPQKEALQRLCSNLRIDTRVSFLGYVNLDDIRSTWRSFDFGIVSLGPGLGLRDTLPRRFATFIGIGIPVIGCGSIEVHRIIDQFSCGSFISTGGELREFIESQASLKKTMGEVTWKRLQITRCERAKNFFSKDKWLYKIANRLCW